MTNKTGGAAFPHPDYETYIIDASGRGAHIGASGGMTLRDWYIGQSIGAIIIACKNDTREKGETHEQMFARKAAAVADALLTARNAQ